MRKMLLIILISLSSQRLYISTAQESEALPYFGIEVTNSLKGDVGSGGFEQSIGRKVLYNPALENKSKMVLDETVKWAKQKKMQILKIQTDDTKVLIHVLSSSTMGFYEILYRFEQSKDGTAHIFLSFYYFDKDGIQMLPDSQKAESTNELQAILQALLT